MVIISPSECNAPILNAVSDEGREGRDDVSPVCARACVCVCVRWEMEKESEGEEGAGRLFLPNYGQMSKYNCFVNKNNSCPESLDKLLLSVKPQAKQKDSYNSWAMM